MVVPQPRRSAVCPSPAALRPSRVALWAPVVGYMALIFGLSSVSHPPATPIGADKLLHALLYAGLGVLVTRAHAHGWRKTRPRAVLQAALFGALYGASDELHQYFNPPRAVEALDIAADTIGATLGGVGLYAWGIIRGRNAV